MLYLKYRFALTVHGMCMTICSVKHQKLGKDSTNKTRDGLCTSSNTRTGSTKLMKEHKNNKFAALSFSLCNNFHRPCIFVQATIIYSLQMLHFETILSIGMYKLSLANCTIHQGLLQLSLIWYNTTVTVPLYIDHTIVEAKYNHSHHIGTP